MTKRASQLHATLIARQSDDELKRKAETARARNKLWQQEDLDWAARKADRMIAAIFKDETSGWVGMHYKHAGQFEGGIYEKDGRWWPWAYTDTVKVTVFEPCATRLKAEIAVVAALNERMGGVDG